MVAHQWPDGGAACVATIRGARPQDDTLVRESTAAMIRAAAEPGEWIWAALGKGRQTLAEIAALATSAGGLVATLPTDNPVAWAIATTATIAIAALIIVGGATGDANETAGARMAHALRAVTRPRAPERTEIKRTSSLLILTARPGEEPTNTEHYIGHQP